MFYLSTTCLCALPCLKNRKRNWCHRQSRHDIYALDNCDDVAQAKAAVHCEQKWFQNRTFRTQNENY